MSCSLRVKRLEGPELGGWDAFLSHSLQGSIFHNSRYLDIFRERMDVDYRIVACLSEGEIVGGCVYFLHHKLRAFHFANGSSFSTPFVGFVIRDYGMHGVRKNELMNKQILDCLYDYLSTQGYMSIHIPNSPAFIDVRPLKWRGMQLDVHYANYIDISDFGLSGLPKDVRRHIRKSVGDYTLIPSTPETHYDLLSKVFHRQGMKCPAPLSLFEDVINLIESDNCGKSWALLDKEKPVASRIFLWDEKSSYAWSAASDPEYRNRGINEYLLFEVLTDMKDMGMPHVNMMQGNVPQYSEFITKFGSRLVPYYSVRQEVPSIQLMHLLRSLIR